MLEQHRRAKVAGEVSGLLAEYIEREILRCTLRRLDVWPRCSRDSVFRSVRGRLRESMFPLVVIVQHYLELCGEAALAMMHEPDELEGCGFSNDKVEEALVLWGREVMDQYGTEELQLAHKFWLSLVWLLEEIVNGVGGDRHHITWWKRVDEPLVDGVDLRRFMLLTNVAGLRDLIRSRDQKERRDHINTTLERLHPGKSGDWQENWQSLSMGLESRPTEEQARRASSLCLRPGSLWLTNAMGALKSRGVKVQGPAMHAGTPWQTMDFLCDIAGYDVLLTPPSLVVTAPSMLTFTPPSTPAWNSSYVPLDEHE